MIERLQQQRNSPTQAIGVPESELSAWYSTVHDAIIREFGKDSSQFAAFYEVNQKANDHKNAMIRQEMQKEQRDFVGGYIGYLQTVIAYLVSFEGDAPRTDVTLRWLARNVPVKLWASAAVVLGTAFILGLQASRLEWIRVLFKLP